MPACSSPVSCSSPRSGSAGSALSRSRSARSLASSASYCSSVMTSGSSALIRWLISSSPSWVVEALDQDEPLDRDTERGGHDLVHRRVRHLHPHHVAAPLRSEEH